MREGKELFSYSNFELDTTDKELNLQYYWSSNNMQQYRSEIEGHGYNKWHCH